MNILIFNSGSSSIKYRLFDMSHELVRAAGFFECIGNANGFLSHSWQDDSGAHHTFKKTQTAMDHQAALAVIDQAIRQSGGIDACGPLVAVGHRVVHGGELYREPMRISRSVLDGIRSLFPLAPLHNPPNLAAIEVSLKLFPGIPQVAVFDTTFHQSMPPRAFRYALPEAWYAEHHIRRYGFHGTSHRYVARQAAEYLKQPLGSLNLITLHLGNGASATAVKGGQCIDTSMGMTPLEGLMMGTRSGDLDPAILFHLLRTTNMSPADLERMLNQESGLKGIGGVNDMRELLDLQKTGHAQAALAVDMFCYRIKKYIGAYLAALGRVDALVFTGGIGENSSWIRQQSCADLEALGIGLDAVRNESAPNQITEIQSLESKVKLLVIPTNEELEIARQTVEVIQARS